MSKLALVLATTNSWERSFFLISCLIEANLSLTKLKYHYTFEVYQLLIFENPRISQSTLFILVETNFSDACFPNLLLLVTLLVTTANVTI